MGCVSTCAGCLLVTLNVIFLLIALAIGGIGGFIKWGNVDILLQPLTKSVESVTTNEEAKSAVNEFANQVFDLLRQSGLALFIVGLTLAIITLLAVCGVCCQSKCLLITYSFIVFIFLGGMTTLTVLAYVKKDDIKNAGGNELKKFITKHYKGPNDSNQLFKGVSGVLDILQVTSKCCGITNYTDFDGAEQWTNRTFVFHHSSGNQRIFANLTIPPSCCKFSSDKKNIQNMTCLDSPNALNSNMYNPCYDKLWAFVDSAWNEVRYVLIGITAFILLLFLTALCAMRFEKEKIDPI